MIAGFACIVALLSTTACAFPAEIVTLLPARACAIQAFSYRCSPPRALISLELSRSPGEDADSDDDDGSNSKGNRSERRRSGRKDGRSRASPTAGRGFGMVNQRRGGGNSTTGSSTATVVDAPDETKETLQQMEEMSKRMTQLESIVAKQSVEIRKLKQECRTMQEAAEAFHQVIELLRASGLQTDQLPSRTGKPAFDSDETTTTLDSLGQDDVAQCEDEEDDADDDDDDDDDDDVDMDMDLDDTETSDDAKIIYEYFDDAEIFGEAPSSVTDAADNAGAAILAGVLGGKQRMLVDVRDSELSGDPDTLVQFIELAILPVAAGLEGLLSSRNRVKLVFPTVSQLLQYRKKMALSAPEVVALSTLGFDPVEDQDNIVVILAPSPDDEEGLKAMNELLEPPEWKKDQWISQPVVVLNHHMVPISGPAANFEVMYHLRLLSVQYMSSARTDPLVSPFEEESRSTDDVEMNVTAVDKRELVDTLLEEAMRHAHQAGVHHGVTRAMVIRSYPK
jgi:Domain of unknown function (DUF1995)